MNYKTITRRPSEKHKEHGLSTAHTLNRSTFGAQRLRLQANGGFCRRVPSPREGIKTCGLSFLLASEI